MLPNLALENVGVLKSTQFRQGERERSSVVSGRNECRFKTNCLLYE
jgi:hypothetical protein